MSPLRQNARVAAPADRAVGDVIAHAATPWAWRSKVAVQCLVVFCVAMFGLSVAWPFLDGQSEGNLVAQAGFNGVLGFALFLWPGLRSWRRWRESHPGA